MGGGYLHVHDQMMLSNLFKFKFIGQEGEHPEGWMGDRQQHRPGSKDLVQVQALSRPLHDVYACYIPVGGLQDQCKGPCPCLVSTTRTRSRSGMPPLAAS